MTDEELKEKYVILNSSFKKTFIFHIGVNAGFFSEYNNMVLAVLYCLKHKIKFMLYSDDANFKLNAGYTDLFIPFCEEVHDSRLSKLNFRWYDKKSKKLKTEVEKLKKLLGIDYFTQDLWKRFCNNFTHCMYFSIPELEIKGFTREAARQVLRFLWKFNIETQKMINENVKKIPLPLVYSGFHIRGGDKIIEADLVGCNDYLERAIKNNSPKDAFVLTDDYRIFESICSKYKDWNFYTLCEKTDHGYYHSEYMKLSTEEKFKKLINLLSSVEVLSKASMFYGTYTSNPGMFLGMKMKKDSMIALDRNTWVTRW